jgi:hypothetical protein
MHARLGLPFPSAAPVDLGRYQQDDYDRNGPLSKADPERYGDDRDGYHQPNPPRRNVATWAERLLTGSPRTHRWASLGPRLVGAGAEVVRGRRFALDNAWRNNGNAEIADLS